MNYEETIKERLKILPDQLKSFVLDENWRRDAEKIGKQFNLSEEKYALFEDEIFFVLLCYELKTNLVKNMERELQIETSVAGQIFEEVSKNILSKIPSEIDWVWEYKNTLNTEKNRKEFTENQSEKVEEIKNEEKPKENQAQNNIGQSFEQIILNQAKAMMPAIAPDNLPTGEQNQNEPPKAIHNYIGESDPYREPAE